jgi:hypothetical protein
MLAQAGPWAGWKPASCMPEHCFCEQVREAIVRQPANAASSLAFVLVGLCVARMAWADRRGGAGSLLARHPAYSWIYAAACILIGIGSAFYHASLTFAGQFADVFGMYLLGSFVLLYAAARERNVAPALIFGGYALLNGLLLLPLYFVPGTRRYLFAILIISAIFLEILAARRSRLRFRGAYFRWALASFAAGFAIWILDITKTVCIPDSLLQGHALWHLAGAASAVFIYLYYRSGVHPEEAGARTHPLAMQ